MIFKLKSIKRKGLIVRNRAKCKLCQTVIESVQKEEEVSCKCDEISVYGGTEGMKCAARHWENFVRVDDEGNEIVIKVEGNENKPVSSDNKPNKEELLNLLNEMVKNIENLPPPAMQASVNHYDLYSFMILVYSILRES